MSDVVETLPPRVGRSAARYGLLNELSVAFATPRTRQRRRSPPAVAPDALEPRSARPSTPLRGEKDDPALRAMPEDAPRPMPVQDLGAAPARARRPAAEAGVARNRVILLAGALAIALLDGLILTLVLGRDGVVSPWEAVNIILSTLLSAWLGFGFISATAGFLVSFFARKRRPPLRLVHTETRTAILLPTYNEDPGLIFAAAQAIAEEAARVGLAERCDVVILSDTRDAGIARAEATALLRTRARLQGGVAIHYRRRALNTDRKAGNIGEWVERQGGAYDYMLVLDADSLMSGETVAEMIARMDDDPGLGLLQTVPTIVNAATPFARLQQFANRLYGPIFARGQQWWSGSEGNYWGHNAILRVEAFAACARLPHLPGRKPFGGHIMSHDFVEAALLRRAGWAVRMIAELPGSYEESPPTLLDTAARDRRWCQGNLQHARILKAAGLHWVSRLHLLCGIFAYVTPLLWVGLLVSGAVVWPEQHMVMGSWSYQAMCGLFALSLGLLAAPKLMALLLAIRAPEVRRGFGGSAQLVVGVLVESVASVLTTPVMMMMQSMAVIDVLAGRDSGWSAQHREGVALSRRDAWRAHSGHVLLGVAGAVGAFFLSRSFFVWTSPVFLSLAMSALLSVHSSRPLSEAPADQPRLFQIPEDACPPPVLERSLALRRLYAAEAAVRRQIDGLFAAPARAYDLGATKPLARRASAGGLALVA